MIRARFGVMPKKSGAKWRISGINAACRAGVRFECLGLSLCTRA